MRAMRVVIPYVLLIAGCAAAQLPTVVPLPIHTPALPCCDTLFPSGRWQFYHQIDAQVRGRSMGQLTGVSVVSSSEGTIACALMTVEGMVLFSARYDGRIIVDRAVSPFDRPGFAQGLMDDLRLLFFKPTAPLMGHGRLTTGETIWRFGNPGGDTTDIVIKNSQQWNVRSYLSNGRLQRTIEASGVDGRHFPAVDLTIHNRGRMEYYLKLKLLDSLPLDHVS